MVTRKGASSRTGTLSCDNFSPQNSALWLAGTVEKKTQAAQTISGEKRKVLPGRQYQLGATAENPLGVRNVTDKVYASSAGTMAYLGAPRTADVTLRLRF